MTRDTTIIKQKIVIDRFHQLLRSGKDYETNYMYKEAGRPAYMTEEGAGKIIRTYYRGLITEKMVNCVSVSEEKSRNDQIKVFSAQFKLCERESRLIIRYIRRRKKIQVESILDKKRAIEFMEASKYE
jgi:hypothetical protein